MSRFGLPERVRAARDGVTAVTGTIIAEETEPIAELVERLSTIPGVKRRTVGGIAVAGLNDSGWINSVAARA